MNVKNIDRLIDRLKKVPEGAFDMGEWIAGKVGDSLEDALYGHSDEESVQRKIKKAFKKQEESDKHTCGTVACIAGYAAMIAIYEDKAPVNDVSIVARNWLELTSIQAEVLFVPNNVEHSWSDITPKHAVKVLKQLKKTGRVSWRKALKEE